MSAPRYSELSSIRDSNSMAEYYDAGPYYIPE